MVEKRKKYRSVIIALVIILISCLISPPKSTEEEKESRWKEILLTEVSGQMESCFFMLPAFLENGSEFESDFSYIEQQMVKEVPLYYYMLAEEETQVIEDDRMEDLIRLQEGSDEDRKEIEEDALDYDDSALHIENSMLEEMQRENNLYLEEEEEKKRAEQPEIESQPENAPETEESFQIAAYPAYTYDWSENWGYDELVSNFYAIDNTTSLKEEYVNLENLLYRDLSIENEEGDAPQILIYHTHSQEAFVDSVEGDPSTTIVGAGEKLASLLEEEYGFKVLHHKGEYDVDSRDDAYANSLPAIEQLLAEYPSIEVVIDLHRDEMKEGKKLVMDLQGRPTARFMFFNGMSYIRDKGDISYLENAYIKDNLAFSFQAQVAANEYYPGIARRIYLKAYRYNMHLRPKSMLIELGAQTNTVEEIMNACDPLAHIIAIVLKEEM